jgi:hypothetical protein
MSEIVHVKLYFGNGKIRYGEHGVDLGEFNSVKKDINRAAERTWRAVTNWLYKTFSVDLEQHDLPIMTLISRSDLVCWELMPLQVTSHWRSYIRNACQIGLPVVLLVQVVHKAGSSSQVPEEDYGADHGEACRNGAALRQKGEMMLQLREKEEMRRKTMAHPLKLVLRLMSGKKMKEVLRRYDMEAEDDELGLEEDSSDDEDEPLVLSDLQSYNFSQVIVNPSENVP